MTPPRIRPWVSASPETTRAFLDQVAATRPVDAVTFEPPEVLRARQDTLFARQMGWLAEASPHYGKVFAAHGIDAGDLRSLEDLRRLPVTTKAELMADPPSFRLRFPEPSLYDMTYTTVFTTGTTSGRPTPYEYTGHDFFGVLESGGRMFSLLGTVPGDRFFNAFPLSPLPHVAGFTPLLTSAAGLHFLHGLTGTPYPEFPVHRPVAAVARLIEANRPDVVSGIGSFLRRLFVDAAADGRDLSTVKVILASGEVLTGRMRDHMRAHLTRCGAEDVFIAGSYGFTEGGMAWAPCVEGGPMHASAPDQVVLEALDPDTHQPRPDGEPGVIALTHLNRRGMPLLRYLLGDIGALSHEPCSHCGRRVESLLVSAGSANVSRTSELLKIKGTLVNPQVIHDVVMKADGVLEYQLVVTNRVEGDALSGDRLVLRVGLEPGTDPAAWDQEVLRQAVFNSTEVRPDVEVAADVDTIYDPLREVKARRIVDRRAPLT